MAYFLFLLVNATLFIRPAEVFGIREAENVYQYLMIACLAVALPDLLAYLSNRPLSTQPITLCVFGLLLAVPLAFGAMGNLNEAMRAGVYFAKVVVYYLLFVSLITTSARLHNLLRWLLIFGGVLTLLSVLNLEGVIHLQSLKPLDDSEVDALSGDLITFQRLMGTGIFQDPNEMCMMLAALLPLCLHALTDSRAGLLKALWLAELLLFGYAIYLTRSRGGFLALVAGLGVFVCARFGWRRALNLGALGLPVLLLLFAGRQTQLDAGAGTAKTRIELWSDWMMVFRGSPIFGEGIPLGDETKEGKLSLGATDHLAHNSYLQAFADMGLLGGPLFLGAFFLALWSLRRLGPGTTLVDPGLRRMRPYLLGCVAAYAVGLLSLSLCYMVPTYLILGLAVAFANMAVCYPPVAPLHFDGKVLTRFATLSAGYLAALYVFVRVFIHRI